MKQLLATSNCWSRMLLDLNSIKINALRAAAVAAAVVFFSSDTATADFDGPYEMQNWSSSGILEGTTLINPDSGPTDTAEFSYNVNLGNPGGGVTPRFADFTAIAAGTGTVTCDYTYSGFHAFFLTNAQFLTIGDTVTVVEDFNPFDAFSVSGSVSFDVTEGQPLGFRIGGENFDSDSRLIGTLTITNFNAPGGKKGGFCPPTSFNTFRGTIISAQLSDFVDSDDVRARYNPGFVLNSAEAPVWLEFFANCPTAIDVQVESQAGTPGLTYTVEARNYNTGLRDVIGTQAESFNNDQVVTFALTADQVDANGDVECRVGWRKTGLTINFPWEVRIDQVGWNQ